jgi:hypothetical protein
MHRLENFPLGGVQCLGVAGECCSIKEQGEEEREGGETGRGVRTAEQPPGKGLGLAIHGPVEATAAGAALHEPLTWTPPPPWQRWP